MQPVLYREVDRYRVSLTCVELCVLLCILGHTARPPICGQWSSWCVRTERRSLQWWRRRPGAVPTDHSGRCGWCEVSGKFTNLTISGYMSEICVSGKSSAPAAQLPRTKGSAAKKRPTAAAKGAERLLGGLGGATPQDAGGCGGVQPPRPCPSQKVLKSARAVLGICAR